MYSKYIVSYLQIDLCKYCSLSPPRAIHSLFQCILMFVLTIHYEVFHYLFHFVRSFYFFLISIYWMTLSKAKTLQKYRIRLKKTLKVAYIAEMVIFVEIRLGFVLCYLYVELLRVSINVISIIYLIFNVCCLTGLIYYYFVCHDWNTLTENLICNPVRLVRLKENRN